MKRSTDRILTTHTGSLPRPPDLLARMGNLDQRGLNEDPAFRAEVRDAVRGIVEKQAEVGVDVVNDGEMGKVGYSTYVTERLTGFAGESRPIPPQVETRLVPDYYRDLASPIGRLTLPTCNGPIRYRGQALVQQDIADLKAALQGVPAAEA